MILTNKNKTLQLRNNLFWDIPNIEAGKNDLIIIERVVKRGNIKEFIGILNFYNSNLIKSLLLRIKDLDKRTINFLSNYFHINKDKFAC